MSVTTIRLPDLGEGVTEGEIVKIQVKEGQKIALDQVLLEVMTDKASMEVPSSIEGLVKKVTIQEGDIVPVGAGLFLVETEGDTSADTESAGTELAGSKSVDTESADSSSLAGSSESKMSPSPSEPSSEIKKQESPSSQLSSQSQPSSIPSTRKLAQELGIDLGSAFKNQDQVTRKELINLVKQGLSQQTQVSSAFQQPEGTFKEKKRVPVRGVQRLMFESMTFSKANIPHFSLGETAQVDHLIQLRVEMKNRLEKQGLKVGYLPFFMKALIPVLEEFPQFNAFYDSPTKELVFKEALNFGFAVDSPQGLMVPVIKEVQNKSLLKIIQEVYEKAKACRESSIAREDLQGSSLTLTNLGGIGGMYGTPIIPPSEMAILGIYKMYPQVIKTKDGTYEERQFMNFSITCDHRFIDGATAVRFLKSFIEKIEEPSLLLL